MNDLKNAVDEAEELLADGAATTTPGRREADEETMITWMTDRFLRGGDIEDHRLASPKDLMREFVLSLEDACRVRANWLVLALSGLGVAQEDVSDARVVQDQKPKVAPVRRAAKMRAPFRRPARPRRCCDCKVLLDGTPLNRVWQVSDDYGDTWAWACQLCGSRRSKATATNVEREES